MEEIIAQINDWPFLHKLPARQAGFFLRLDLAQDGPQYTIFSYRNEQELRSISVLYDGTTKDFLARVAVGLNEFYDISFICSDFAGLEKTLAAKLPSALDRLGEDRQYESIFRAKKILEWPFGAQLPGEIAGFRLFIRPARPLKTINGSYVILDYSDFGAASNLSVSYNVYRDEFYGQQHFHRTPQMLAAFDARDLGELASRLDQNLQPALQALRRRLTITEGYNES
jgi:hypothetical protein